MAKSFDQICSVCHDLGKGAVFDPAIPEIDVDLMKSSTFSEALVSGSARRNSLPTDKAHRQNANAASKLRGQSGATPVDGHAAELKALSAPPPLPLFAKVRTYTGAAEARATGLYPY